jgi:hypothetical protein
VCGVFAGWCVTHIDVYQPKQALYVSQGCLASTLHIAKMFSVSRIEFICKYFVEIIITYRQMHQLYHLLFKIYVNGLQIVLPVILARNMSAP